jgi:hypothetical protein
VVGSDGEDKDSRMQSFTSSERSAQFDAVREQEAKLEPKPMSRRVDDEQRYTVTSFCQ